MIRYPIDLTPDDGTLLVTCPDLPEVTSFGETEACALAHGADAVEEAIAGRLRRFEDLPRPTAAGELSAPVGLALALKASLYWSMQDAGWSRADLVRALGWQRNSVDRLFNPRHATRIEQYEAAFAALGRRVGVQVEEAA